MRNARRRTFNILASIIVPPALLTMLIVVTQELRLTGLRELGLLAPLLVLIPGFWFLVREFRMYALAIAIIYLPGCYWLTNVVSFYAALMLYGLNE